MRLENELTKNQILEDYLNLVSFGNNAYGIEVAAERYFNESMVHLTLPQSALLAGLVQAPSALDPIKHPAEAARRRRQVLQAMVATHKITVRQETAANASPLPTKLFYPKASQRSYYIDAVLNQLSSSGSEAAVGSRATCSAPPTPRRSTSLYEGGLQIYTNYDPVMQFEATSRSPASFPTNQSQFTAALVVDRQHQRRGARGRLRARLPGERVRSRGRRSRPPGRVRRSRASPSRPRFRPATRPTTG